MEVGEGTFVPVLPPGTGLMRTRHRDPHATWTSTNPEAGTRRCRRCKEWKPLDEFHRNSWASCGRQHCCKACVAADYRATRQFPAPVAAPPVEAPPTTLRERLAARRRAEAAD